VKRLLLNCDQVFDVLTRGPFPSGDPQDEAVERHLRACHECRQLAEALRPAVALMHEAVSSDEADQLPEYQGSLPWQSRPGRKRNAVVHLESLPETKSYAPPTMTTISRGEPRRPQIVSFIRLIAASLILAALGLLFGGTVFSPRTIERPNEPTVQVEADHRASGPADGIPTAQGLLTLASFKLPHTCVPFSHRPVSAVEAAQIASAISDSSLNGLRCCTECHHAGANPANPTRFVASIQQSCQACHRG